MAASVDLLARLHEMVGEKLLARIESGEASASEFAQAIKFLKDNGIEAVKDHNGNLQQLEGALASRLPFSNSSDPTVQ